MEKPEPEFVHDEVYDDLDYAPVPSLIDAVFVGFMMLLLLPFLLALGVLQFIIQGVRRLLKG